MSILSRKANLAWVSGLLLPALLFFLSGCQSQHALLAATESPEQAVMERQVPAQAQADSSLPTGCRWTVDTSGRLLPFCPDPTPPRLNP